MFNLNHPLYKVPLAHRGLYNARVDENSMTAFKLAVEAGVGIELDIHMTKDEKIVVMHDTTTKRTMNGDLDVRHSTYAELLALNLKLTGEKIPLLSEVLTLVNGQVPILIELKVENEIPPFFVENVFSVIKDYPAKHMLGLQCFNPYVTKALKTNPFGILVGQLMSDKLEGQTKLVNFLFRSLLVLKISKPDFFNYDVNYIHKRNIQRKKRKLPLITWTIDTDAKYAIAKKYAHNSIFEHIEI